MVWVSDRYYELKAKGEFAARIELDVDDGWRIRLYMDCCTDDECQGCRFCSMGAIRDLTIEETKELHSALGKLINEYKNDPQCSNTKWYRETTIRFKEKNDPQ